MAASAYEKASNKDALDIVLRIDRDDPAVSDYVEEARKYPTVSVVVGDRVPVPQAVNEIALIAKGDILAIICDDALLRTAGWDSIVRAADGKYKDGLYVAFPDAGDGQVRVGHFFTGKEWVKLFGRAMPGIFEHFSADDWVEQVAKGANRLLYMPNLLVEHMHRKYRKSDNDDTYRSKRIVSPDGTHPSGRDKALFDRTGNQREAEIAKLKAALQC
jgi:hypothetical protein